MAQLCVARGGRGARDRGFAPLEVVVEEPRGDLGEEKGTEEIEELPIASVPL